MKKTKVAAAALCLALLLMLTGCSSSVEGTYSGAGPLGVPISMTFHDGIVQTNMLWGIPLNGTYSVEGKSVKLKFQAYGMDETIYGQLSGNQVIFADATLTKE